MGVTSKLKIARLFKNLKPKKKGTSYLNKLKMAMASKEGYLQLVPIFASIFLVCHIVACFWHFFGYYDKNHETWIQRNQYRDESNIDRYTASLYFVLQTVRNVNLSFKITTVGYGDIGVATKTEFAIAIILMFGGVISYSNILTELLDLISSKIQLQDRA